MPYDIQPFIGAGDICFGMTPEQVRSCLRGRYSTFKRGGSTDEPSDHFESIGVIVSYKLPGLVNTIEFYTPSKPVFEGVNLLAVSFREMVDFLRTKDMKLRVEFDGVYSDENGIAAYAPLAKDDPDSPVESVIAFEKGYYD
ncbi:hypothetical protein [uncultured Roseovarius sp.]|uniref:hypothetical protein n=1 Tax=uncultured Roseovarius sp. TaxID=293344 RepID=UPI002625196E|nr:hypothetical protein [uncultured Roseovarius sp.]